jgi:hypothetical protein
LLAIKILSLQYPERYAVRRLVAAAQQELQQEFPHLEVEISEVSDSSQICRYANVLVLPTLVINEKVVCSGKRPSLEEVSGWLMEAASQE